MNTPLISIIIPVFNVENYIRHCVNSVRNQTYKNLEIILVDDGSADSSGRLCDEFEKADGRIRVIHKLNAGLSSARNAGLDICTGEFIAFVDSDDYIHPEYISTLYNAIKDTDCNMAICNFRKIFSNKEDFKHPEINNFEVNIIDYETALKELVGFDSVLYVLSWNKLYKRDIFSDLRFPEGKISEDFYVSFKVLHLANKIAVTKAQLYYYFLRRGSIIHSRDNVSEYNFEALDEFDEYTKKLGIDLTDKSLFIRCNSVMEDYYAAYKNRNEKRLKETDETFKRIKKQMDVKGVPLNHKGKLFDRSKALFILERGLIDIVGNIKIRLNLYR